MVTTVNLDAYFQRINWRGGREPTLETLAGLINAHTAHIPFENLAHYHALRLAMQGVFHELGIAA